MEIVNEDYLPTRRRLLEHPAFSGIDPVYLEQMSNGDLRTYSQTWEQHTERGRAWAAEHPTVEVD